MVIVKADVSELKDLSDVDPTLTPSDEEILKYDTSDTQFEAATIGAGTGDVVGPGSAVDENLTVFDSTTGKLIKDSGINQQAVTDNTAKVTNATHSGEVTGATTLTIAADAVTYAKIQNVVADNRILGNVSGAGVIVAELAKADVLTMINVEDGADVTDTTNVTAAGALMDSEVDVDIKTLSLPASTTISVYGASLVDDADAATARATLDVDQAGTDNSTDVTLAGTPDYITITGQVITRGPVVLTTDVSGVLPIANIATGVPDGTKFVRDDGTLVTPSGSGDVSKVGTPVDSQVGVWTGDGTIEGATSLTYDGTNFQFTGDLGATGTRITKGWFTDFVVTNAITADITGNSATVTTNANLSGDVTSVGNATTIAAKAVDIAMLADGTDGELITWSAAGVAATVAVGTATHVLTSNGVGAAPTFQAVAGGGGASALIERTIEGEIRTGTMMPITILDEHDGLDIKEIRAVVSGLPVGADIEYDVRLNGVASTDSVYTSDVVAGLGTGESAINGLYQAGCDTSGSTVGTAGTTIDGARDTVAANDVLWIVVTQVGSTFAGADLGVSITLG